MPVPVQVWVIVVELAATIPWLTLPAEAWSPTAHELAVFAALFAAAMLHTALCRAAEERRRALHVAEDGGSIDTSCVWLLPAAFLLPLPLAAALLLFIRAQRWSIARRSMTRFGFSVLVVFHSQAAVHWVARLTGLDNPSSARTLLGVAGLGACALLYATVQTLLIGTVKCLQHGEVRAVHFGTAWEHGTFLAALSGGVILIMGASTGTWAPLVLLPATVGATKLAQHTRQLQRDRDQLSTDALHDPLTALPNRRGFTPRGELAVTADLTSGGHCAVMMIDIDHFKNWNTVLGHFGADQVLIAVADVLRAHTRHADLLCRWGGEEIAVVLPSTTPEQALTSAERIRHAIQHARIATSLPSGEHPITLGAGDWPPVTVSIGLALAPRDGTDLTTVQQAADRALQTAKDTGRNRVAHAPLPAATTTTDFPVDIATGSDVAPRVA